MSWKRGQPSSPPGAVAARVDRDANNTEASRAARGRVRFIVVPGSPGGAHVSSTRQREQGPQSAMHAQQPDHEISVTRKEAIADLERRARAGAFGAQCGAREVGCHAEEEYVPIRARR